MISSKNIDGIQEITLVAPLKLGVVPCTEETLSYASRLRLFLAALFSQRKLETELNREETGLLESLQVLDFVRWAIIDDDRKLMLCVSFDGPWEPYIRKIVEDAGPVLDAIFCHCADYAGSSCYDGYPKFSAWVRSHQIDIPFIHAANADLSVDDVRYLKAFERAHSSGSSAPFALPSMPYLPSVQPLSRVYALFGLRALFVGDGGTLTDREYYDRVSRKILEPDFPNLSAALTALKAANPKPGLREAATAAWLRELMSTHPEPHPRGPSMTPFIHRSAEIQGNILRAYSETIQATHGAIALVRFKGKAEGAAFLRRISKFVSFEEDDRAIKLNLALTFEGLRTLGLTSEELALFPREFQEGLERRAGLLGDIGANHPERWALPEGNWPLGNPSREPIVLSLVDAVLNVQTYSESPGHELLDDLSDFLRSNVQAAGHEIEILHVQPTRRYGTRGHVGAEDGVSQPIAKGQSLGPFAERDYVPPGELLLGYENHSKEPSSVPEGLQLNSTFIAIRKMSQDPAVYASLSNDQFELALGRRRDGKNLIDQTGSNAFDYSKDHGGGKCPFFSHVRRSNPRAEDTPRILRRGMTYGPKYEGQDDHVPRGVMFMAFASSLAEQYEVVQRWVNGGNSTGVFSAQPDLIAGTFPKDSGRKLQCPVAGGGVTTLDVPAKPAAVLEWGLYAFVPSRSALQLLANDQRAPFVAAPSNAPAQPEQDQEQFGAERLSATGDAMKARLEDVFRPDKIKATLQDVLGKKGIGRAPDFGVIIGAPQLVTEALTTPAKYSVRNYWARMRQCDGTFYLGMDPDPKPLGSQPDHFLEEVPRGRYEKEKARANDFILNIGFGEAFATASAAASKWLHEQTKSYEGLEALIAARPELEPALSQPPALDLIAMSARVIRDVACELYGLPHSLLSDDLDLEWPAGSGPAEAHTAVRCPIDFSIVSAHFFPPRPSYAISVEAKARGPILKSRISEWYQHASEQELAASPLLKSIQDDNTDLVERTIVGLISGFAVPTFGSLLGVLEQLVESDELWRLQRLLPIDPTLDEGFDARIQPLTLRVYDLMINRPVPAMVSRTPMFEEPPIKPPEVVGLHLGAAADAARRQGEPDAWKFLFGDLPSAYANAGAATHPCPGQQMALGVIVGTVYGLLAQKRLKKVALDPLTLSKY